MTNPLVGKTLKAVWIAEDRKALRFDPTDGEPIVARCDGDCCSSTWVETIDAPDVLVGARVLAVENIDMPDLGRGREQREDKSLSWEAECIEYYGCKITTERGVCIIDYRNASNGYYGGSLVWPSTDEHDWYYGGVYGQNVSKEEWVPVEAGEVIDGE